MIEIKYCLIPIVLSATIFTGCGSATYDNPAPRNSNGNLHSNEGYSGNSHLTSGHSNNLHSTREYTGDTHTSNTYSKTLHSTDGSYDH